MEMGTRVVEDPQRAYARLAGLMYLVVLAFDLAGLAITSVIQGSGSFQDTSHAIAQWESLYRIGLLCSLVGGVATIVLAIGLYVTLKPVDGNLAMTALLFRTVETATGAAGAVGGFATLQIYLAANHANAFDTKQLSALADLNSGGADGYVAAIFFCVGSTIFFYLFLRSGYVPRLLAAWGVFASLLYLIAFIGSLVVPQASGILVGVGSLPILVAEVSTGLWLLIRGITTQATPSRPEGGR